MTKSTTPYWNPLAAPDDRRWRQIPGLDGMAEELTLSIDPVTGEYTRLTRFLPGADLSRFGPKSHLYPEEVFVVSGRLHDGSLDRWLQAGDYASRPPGEAHGPFRTDAGCVVLEVSFPDRAVNVPALAIRDETAADVAAIAEVTEAAFRTLEISHHTEHFIIAALRAANALAVSLVAEVDGRVVGHVACSPVAASDGTRGWHGLGPLSVLPEYQWRGLGKALIGAALSRLQRLGGRGCCLVGHPGYYPQFGFHNGEGLGVEGVPAEVFFVLAFDGRLPRGTIAFHDAFKADGDPAAPA